MVNAIPHKLLKRSSYYSCPPTGLSTPPALLHASFASVSKNKYKATVSGTFTDKVTKKTKLVIAFVGDSGRTPIAHPNIFAACTGSGCPIKPGVKYNQTVEFQVPDKLSKQFDMVLSVANSESNILGCIEFNVGPE
ncbi:2089_t:CDS:1 [Funneliformis mosseae]|uniref:Phosphatidylglycerol/phosphatidylinositol transfer protein n=1 Tax=Funneliformis mosseae TaxID=27381 RepID=A0A9N8VB97_FUNMO|nr:2089_t:CDS:1 [Funneliformis mosseae]